MSRVGLRVAFLLAPLLAAAAAPGAVADAPLSLASIDEAGTYQVGWNLVETEHEFRGRLGEGEARNLKLDVQQDNVTDVLFSLAWTEDEDDVGVSRMDAFELLVDTPDGVPASGSPARGRDGALGVASGLVNEVPGPVTLRVATADEARDALAPYATTNGQGAWKVTVRLTDTGNPKGASVDAGNSYELKVLVRHYEAVLMRVVSLDAPAPKLSVAEAAAAAPVGWLASAGLLTGIALGLGGWLAVDAVRRGRR